MTDQVRKLASYSRLCAWCHKPFESPYAQTRSCSWECAKAKKDEAEMIRAAQVTPEHGAVLDERKREAHRRWLETVDARRAELGLDVEQPARQPLAPRERERPSFRAPHHRK